MDTDRNESVWRKRAGVIFEDYYGYWEKRPMADDIQDPSAIANLAAIFVDFAYTVHIGGYDAVSAALLDRSVQLSKYVLDNSIVTPWFSRDFEMTPEKLEWERQSTLATVKKNLGMALWLQKRQYPELLFKEAARHGWRYYEIDRTIVNSLSWEALEDHLLAFARADLYFDLNSIYTLESKVRYDNRRRKGQGHSLATVAAYMLGAAEKKAAAEKEVNQWYAKCQDWTPYSDFMLFDRLVWARLRAQLITGREDIYDILDELKGF